MTQKHTWQGQQANQTESRRAHCMTSTQTHHAQAQKMHPSMVRHLTSSILTRGFMQKHFLWTHLHFSQILSFLHHGNSSSPLACLLQVTVLVKWPVCSMKALFSFSLYSLMYDFSRLDVDIKTFIPHIPIMLSSQDVQELASQHFMDTVVCRISVYLHCFYGGYQHCLCLNPV